MRFLRSYLRALNIFFLSGILCSVWEQVQVSRSSTPVREHRNLQPAVPSAGDKTVTKQRHGGQPVPPPQRVRGRGSARQIDHRQPAHSREEGRPRVRLLGRRGLGRRVRV
jgi:hypothetical protein